MRGYVCEVTAEDQYDETPHDWPACADQGMADKGFLAVRDSCYLPVEDTMTFSEAEAHCTGQGDSVHLLSVMDLVENDVAIALSNKRGSDKIWLGLQKSEVITVDRLIFKKLQFQSTWSWSDGWPVQYTNWKNADDPDETCAILKHK